MVTLVVYVVSAKDEQFKSLFRCSVLVFRIDPMTGRAVGP